MATLNKLINSKKRSMSQRKEALISAASGERKKTSRWKDQIETNTTRLNSTNQNIDQKLEALAKARAKLKDTISAAEGLHDRSGKEYENLTRSVREHLSEFAPEGSKEWFEELEKLLQVAKGRDTRVNLDGVYKFANLPKGRYVVYAAHTYRGTPIIWLRTIELGNETNLEMGDFNSIVEPAKNVAKVVKALNTIVEAVP